jgi:hypothetical protein
MQITSIALVCSTSNTKTMISSALVTLSLVGAAIAHGSHDQTPLAGPHKSLWYNTLPGDGGTQVSLELALLENTDPLDL